MGVMQVPPLLKTIRVEMESWPFFGRSSWIGRLCLSGLSAPFDYISFKF